MMKEKETPLKKAQKIELLKRSIADPNLNPEAKGHLRVIVWQLEEGRETQIRTSWGKKV